jgi:hypothetical protein
MKITRSQLKQLIKEEICRIQEQDSVTPIVDPSPSADLGITSPQIQLRRIETEENRSPIDLPDSVRDMIQTRIRRARDQYQRSYGSIDGRLDLIISFDEQGSPVIELQNSDSDIERFLGEEDDIFQKLLRLDINKALETGELSTTDSYTYVGVLT